MPANQLTEAYLAEAAGQGVGPRNLVDVASREVDLGAIMDFAGRLTRPVFLSQAEQAQLATDLENLFGALTALPGLSCPGYRCRCSSWSASPKIENHGHPCCSTTSISAYLLRPRADHRYPSLGFGHEGDVGSTIGGGDNAMLNRPSAPIPDRRFRPGPRLSYVTPDRASRNHDLGRERDQPRRRHPDRRGRLAPSTWRRGRRSCTPARPSRPALAWK